MLAYASGWPLLYTQRRIWLPCCPRMTSRSQFYKSKIDFHWNLSMKYENIFTTRSITETVRHCARFDWWKTWRQTRGAGLPPPGRARRTEKHKKHNSCTKINADMQNTSFSRNLPFWKFSYPWSKKNQRKKTKPTSRHRQIMQHPLRNL